MLRSTRIPQDRIGAFVGKNGGSKKALEERTHMKFDIDKEGEVTWNDEGEGVDPLDALRAMDVVRAIARGFSHDKAMRLFDDDDMYLESINIKEAVGDRQSQVQRARGRIIGREGKTRRIIEDLADVYVSVYGNTVSIIGNSVGLPVAKHAIGMLLSGSEHATVYHYLESQRPRLRIAEMGFDLRGIRWSLGLSHPLEGRSRSPPPDCAITASAGCSQSSARGSPTSGAGRCSVTA